MCLLRCPSALRAAACCTLSRNALHDFKSIADWSRKLVALLVQSELSKMGFTTQMPRALLVHATTFERFTVVTFTKKKRKQSFADRTANLEKRSSCLESVEPNSSRVYTRSAVLPLRRRMSTEEKYDGTRYIAV